MNCTPSASCWRRKNSCGNPECRERSARYTKRNRVMEGQGRPRRVPSGPSAERIRELARIYSYGYIADAHGMSTGQIGRIASGRQKTVAADTARRLAGPLPPPSGRRWVNAAGTYRRLRALALRGWSLPSLAARSGLPVSWLQFVASRNIDQLDHRRAEAVADLFRDLWLIDGPSKITQARARRAGYIPALAWDDIDDPVAEPQGVGASFGPEKADDEAVARLTRAGLTAQQIADQLGTTKRTVSRSRARMRQEAAA